MDQWRAIRDRLETDDKRLADALYAIDALRPADRGRAAGVLSGACSKTWARLDRTLGDCQGDADQRDFAKFATQPAPIPHTTVVARCCCVRAAELRGLEAAARRNKLFKQDGAYNKMFEVAGSPQRVEQGHSANTRLLGSCWRWSRRRSPARAAVRRLRADDDRSAGAAVATSAKSFAGWPHSRDNPFEVRARGGPDTRQEPDGQPAAIAYALCHKMERRTGSGPHCSRFLAFADHARRRHRALRREVRFDDVKARQPATPMSEPGRTPARPDHQRRRCGRQVTLEKERDRR
jgi:hypothetical protein